MNLSKSKELYEKSLRYIPLGTQTLSKAASQFIQPFAPSFIKSGQGAVLVDVDGNEWIDHIAALGPIILGYNNNELNESLIAQLNEGTIFSLSHYIEVELAEKICSVVPGVEKVRFGKNGSDVTSAAVKAARAYTGKSKVLICGYHGWQDWYICTTSKNKGIPKEVENLSATFKYNNIDSLRKLVSESDDVAAIIMESVGVNEPEGNFLQEIRDIATKNGIVLIFDEIVNGFRLAPGGGGEYYSVVPDLITMGKAMGNGVAISAVGGHKDIMKEFDEIFFSFTFAGDTLGIRASLTTIEIMEKVNGYKFLFEQGDKLKKGVNSLIDKYKLTEHLVCKGLPHHTAVEFSEHHCSSLIKKSLLQQECLKQRLLFLGVHFTTLAHDDEIISKSLDIYDSSLQKLANYLNDEDPERFLEGDPIKPVFRKRV